jgi:hypothetical protein
MNWDAIGAIAELLGAIGVIASLVYLATQIRQSRLLPRSSTNLRSHRRSRPGHKTPSVHACCDAAAKTSVSSMKTS